MPDHSSLSLHLSMAVVDAMIARAGITVEPAPGGNRYRLPAEAKTLVGSRYGWTWAKDEAAMWACEIVAMADLSVLA